MTRDLGLCESACGILQRVAHKGVTVNVHLLYITETVIILNCTYICVTIKFIFVYTTREHVQVKHQVDIPNVMLSMKILSVYLSAVLACTLLCIAAGEHEDEAIPCLVGG